MNKHIQGAGGVYGQNIIFNMGQNQPIIAEIWEIGLNIKNAKHKFCASLMPKIINIESKGETLILLEESFLGSFTINPIFNENPKYLDYEINLDKFSLK